MKTKAAVLYEYNKPFVIEELELDDPKDFEVQVKMKAAGACRSDWHVVLGESPDPLPLVLGHEGAGIVEKVGARVTRCKPGDHVVLNWTPACGQCKMCIQGKSYLCDLLGSIAAARLLDGTARLHNQNGEDIGQYLMVGTFSQYSTVPEASITVIEPGYDFDIAALVGCGVGTGYGSAVNRAKVQPGSSVLVIGVGGIGMNAVQGAAACSAEVIIAADKHDHKLEWAKEFGATHTINVNKEDLISKVFELTGGLGADYVFEAYGSPETLGQAIMASSLKGGTTVAIGMSPFATETIPFNPYMFTATSKTLMGGLYGTGNPKVEIPRMLQLNRAGKLKLKELITNKYKLEDINQVYADMEAGKNIRGVIYFD